MGDDGSDINWKYVDFDNIASCRKFHNEDGSSKGQHLGFNFKGIKSNEDKENINPKFSWN
jgi:hypothetical protein